MFSISSLISDGTSVWSFDWLFSLYSKYSLILSFQRYRLQDTLTGNIICFLISFLSSEIVSESTVTGIFSESGFNWTVLRIDAKIASSTTIWILGNNSVLLLLFVSFCDNLLFWDCLERWDVGFELLLLFGDGSESSPSLDSSALPSRSFWNVLCSLDRSREVCFDDVVEWLERERRDWVDELFCDWSLFFNYKNYLIHQVISNSSKEIIMMKIK